MDRPASLVQDVWLGFEPRLRARRLAPWRGSEVRLLFQLDAGESLDDPPLGAFLERLAQGLELLAFEPRGSAAESGRPGPEALEDAQRLAEDGGRRFGERTLFVGGHGLGGWIALAAASARGVSGAIAVAPALAKAGAVAPQPSPLRARLASVLASAAPAGPVLVLEGRERPPAEARVVAEWIARSPRAMLLAAAGQDGDLLRPPWPGVIAAWARGLGAPA